MSDYLTSRVNLEDGKKFESLRNQKAQYLTPKKLIKPHQRITSLNYPLNESSKKPSFSSKKEDPPSRNHQKTQSMLVNPQKLELRIKKLEHSMDKKNMVSTISTSTQSIDFLGEENSICVSYSSEDSITILRQQVKNVKTLTDLSGNYSNACKLKFDDDSFTKISNFKAASKTKAFKALKITDLALFNSIPVINLN